MDAAAWLSEHATLRFPVEAFACLEGCGFCCTYPPQLQQGDFQALHQATGLTHVGVDPEGDLRLPLQGGCGGCVLLEERRCTAYEQRPRHCRLFPFHVYFGRTVEVHTDLVCPGLDPAPELDPGAQPAPVPEALARAVATVPPEALQAHAHQAREVHAEFQQRASDAGVWQDPDEARRSALEGVSITEEAWDEAIAPFQAEATELLPTMVLPRPGFPWRMWSIQGGRLRRLLFTEAGALDEVGHLGVPEAPEGPGGISPAVRETLGRLVGTECFVGAAFDLVDASAYELDVGDAVQSLVDQVAASLALREPLLRAEGIEPEPRWLAAAYEPEFFDLPSIGGWL